MQYKMYRMRKWCVAIKAVEREHKYVSEIWMVAGNFPLGSACMAFFCLFVVFVASTLFQFFSLCDHLL